MQRDQHFPVDIQLRSSERHDSARLMIEEFEIQPDERRVTRGGDSIFPGDRVSGEKGVGTVIGGRGFEAAYRVAATTQGQGERQGRVGVGRAHGWTPHQAVLLSGWQPRAAGGLTTEKT